jgi:hypothetical protein
MHTVRLKINDKVFDRLIWLLSKFSKDELEIINEDAEFFESQKYLEQELSEMNSGQATFIPLDAAEQKLEYSIKKNENSL